MIEEWVVLLIKAKLYVIKLDMIKNMKRMNQTREKMRELELTSVVNELNRDMNMDIEKQMSEKLTQYAEVKAT